MILIRRTTGIFAFDHPTARHRAPGQEQDTQQQQGGPAGPARRARPALALAAAAWLLAGCSSSVDDSHEPSVVSTAPPAALAAPASFEQRIEGTTVTVDMVRIAEATADTPALWMSRTEIPWDLYDVFLYRLDGESNDDADGVSRPSKPYVPPDRGFGHAGYPAMGMTFHAAEAFCHWLSVRTGRTYRLPTDAEWTSACAAGSAREAASAGGESAINPFAWHAGNADNTTHPVGEKEPNALGLHDLLGNVAEWARGGDGRPIALGGSYLDAAAAVTCDARQRQTPAWNTSDPQIPKSRWWLADCSFVGFRIVCEGDAAAE